MLQGKQARDACLVALCHFVTLQGAQLATWTVLAGIHSGSATCFLRSNASDSGCSQ